MMDRKLAQSGGGGGGGETGKKMCMYVHIRQMEKGKEGDKTLFLFYMFMYLRDTKGWEPTKTTR